ncbi:hypothetical protein [Glycomyces algeriensis]|nr:hypothetical protein [Glycomyces algeriensis]MDA1364657.1 hypothetical protein [Glycomyces algeriensis]MDR7350695.1 hypothetical protein [Glycomyces algeriensis]
MKLLLMRAGAALAALIAVVAFAAPAAAHLATGTIVRGSNCTYPWRSTHTSASTTRATDICAGHAYVRAYGINSNDDVVNTGWFGSASYAAVSSSTHLNGVYFTTTNHKGCSTCDYNIISH